MDTFTLYGVSYLHRSLRRQLMEGYIYFRILCVLTILSRGQLVDIQWLTPNRLSLGDSRNISFNATFAQLVCKAGGYPLKYNIIFVLKIRLKLETST